jgi:uncharacterized membrane protein
MTYPSGVTHARIVAAAAAALLLSLAPAASASIWPAPSQPKAQKSASYGLVLTGSRKQRVTTRSCNAHAKVAWWFTPVACEQPPKSQLLVPLLGG